MNDYTLTENPAVDYYDSDYPWREDGLAPENFDEITKFQGLAFDIQRYREIAAETGGPILELCCGTGRVAVPLARAGFPVTAVDNADGVLSQLEAHLERLGPGVREKISVVRQDVTRLSLASRDYPLAIIAFNSLLVIDDFESQLQALRAAASHLKPGGRLVIDIINPLRLNPEGDASPKPFFTRKNPRTGNTYTRFAMMGSFDERHRQKLSGWYDEYAADGTVRRRHYSIHWRPIHRFEIELMLRDAGFVIERIEGGQLREPYSAQSPRMFIQASKEREPN